MSRQSGNSRLVKQVALSVEQQRAAACWRPIPRTAESTPNSSAAHTRPGPQIQSTQTSTDSPLTTSVFLPRFEQRKKATRRIWWPLRFGSSSKTRTCDKLINSQLLYQLSYRGIRSLSIHPACSAASPNRCGGQRKNREYDRRIAPYIEGFAPTPGIGPSGSSVGCIPGWKLTLLNLKGPIRRCRTAPTTAYFRRQCSRRERTSAMRRVA
jgi:hypothetical protein